jgi:O-antigen/teichoic acid export membrane protein
MLKRVKAEFVQARSLLGFVSLQTLGQMVGMAIPFIVALLLDKSSYGQYTLCFITIFFFSALFIISAKNPFIIFANQERQNSGKINKTFTGQCVIVFTGWVIFWFMLLIFRNRFAAFIKLNPAGTEIYFVGLAFLGLAFKDFIVNLFMALNERNKSAMIEFSFGIASLLFLGVFWHYDAINLKTIFLTYFLSAIAVIAIFTWFVEIKMLFPLSFNREHFKGMLDFLLWSIFGAISIYLINYIGPIILERFGYDLKNIGTYNFAFNAFKGLMVLIYIVPNYFLPTISAGINDIRTVQNYLWIKRPRIMLAAILIIAIIWVTFPYVLHAIYGFKWDDSIPLIRIFLIGVVVFTYAAMYGPIYGGLKWYKYPQFVNLTQVAASIALSIWLIKPFGATGVAIACLLSYCVMAGMYEFYHWYKVLPTLRKK